MFNTNNSGYSLSDIAAVTGRNDGMLGDGGWWIILLFLFALGGWGNGNGYGIGGNKGQSEISYSFDMNGLESGVRGIQQGLCDGFYAVNNSMLSGFNGVQNALCQGFAGVNTAIANSGYNTLDAIHENTIANMQNTTTLQNGLTALGTQLASGLCDIGYNMASQANATQRAIADSTRDIIDSNNAGVRSILDFLTQDKIATLTAENQSLKFAASQAAQNAFITANQDAQTAELIRRLGRDCPVPAYVVPNPNCCYPAPVCSC